MQTGYKINTSILDAARILQEVHYTKGDSIVETIMRQIMDTKEEQTRKALISIGWTPPNEDIMRLRGIMQNDILSALDDCAELGMTAGGVREALKTIVTKALHG